MRHTGVSLWLVAGLMFGALVGSSAAQDGGGGGGFWEKMSGPGDWIYFYAYYKTCLDRKNTTETQPGESVEKCIVTKNRVWLNLAGAYASTGAEDREDLHSPDLKQVSAEPSIDFRAFNVSNCVPLLFGVGVGAHRFSGDDVGFWRASIEPRFTLIFPDAIKFSQAGRSFDVGFRYAVKFFLEGFTAQDFGDPDGTYTTNGTDDVHTFSLFFSF